MLAKPHYINMKWIINIFKSSLCLLFIVSCLSSCEQKQPIVQATGDNGQLIFEYQMNPKDSTRLGWFKAYHANGQLSELSNYEQDVLEGLRTMYYEDGTVQIEENYQAGLFEGSYKSYHPNKQLESEGEYKANAMTGEWKFYYDNGQVRELVRFKDNEENGPFVEYHSNGKIKAEGTYLNGDNEHGKLKLFDQKGDIERIMNCQMGRCFTEWARDSLDAKLPGEK